jgi:branched-chain amino acid transport system substrate-binding protein
MRLFLLSLLFTLGCSHSGPGGPVVLGHLNPAQGDDEVHGVALAVEEVNADPAKQVQGRKLKVIHADAGTTPEEAQGQAARLFTVDKVEALLGPARWTQTEKAAQALQPPAVCLPLGGYAGAPPNASLFPVGLAPADQGKALALYSKKALEATRAVVLRETDAAEAGAVARAFADHFGGSVVEHAIKAGDAPDLLKNLTGLKPDVVLLCGSAKSVAAWRARLSAGPPTLLYGGPEADFAALPPDPEPSKWLVAAVSFDPADETPAAKEFVRKFREKYAKPPTPAAALAYDALTVWAEAARRAGSPQPDRVREQLAKGDATFPVLTGTLSYGPGQVPHRPAFVVRQTAEGTKFQARYEP